MIDFKYADLFKQNSVDVQLEIISDDGKIHITNTEFHEEEFELTESLCSQSELTFGAVEAGSVKFKVSNIFLPMKGRWMTIRMIIDGHTDQPFLIGRFKGYSDTPTADRKYRDVVAYDALYDILNADVAAWYNTVFPSHKEQQKDKDGKTTTVTVYDPVTMKQFRDSFFKHFGIEQADIDLINDNMSIEKTVAVTPSSETSSDTEESSTIGESMSGKEVLSCICEINGCMGHMGRDGKFHYIYLEQNIQGLYPRNDLYPADDLFPRDPKSNRIGKDLYITAEYEDFLVKTINKLQIREQKNDIGVIVGTGDNAYVIEDNFLVYGKGTKELKGIAKNILSKIRGIVYRPFTADCKGNPCLEVGDAVRLPTRYELIESYILKRTLKGIQALRDDLEADGEEYRTNRANRIQKSILKLKGKSNVLERTIEKTQSTIENKEEQLISRITQTATEIRTEVKNTTDGLSSRITQNASSITAEVKRAQGQEVELAAAIKINEDKITAEVTRASKTEGELSGKIEVTAEEIRSEVSASLNTWDWDESKYNIIYFGHGDQGHGYKPSSDIENKCYLNLDNGTIWQCVKVANSTYAWEYRANAKLIANSMTSAFKQTSREISTKVQKDNVISSINQTAESIKIKASKLQLDGDTRITGGTIRIETTETVDNIIQLKRPGTLVKMGNDGMYAEADTRSAVFQYSNITVQDSAGGKDAAGNTVATIAQMLSSGKGISSYGWESYSDRRLKHGIKALDKKKSAKVILKLVPCEFIYNFDKSETVRHGFTAQNAMEAVDNEWEVCGKNNVDGTEYYTLDKTNLIADLVATVQLQHEEIKELKETVGIL